MKRHEMTAERYVAFRPYLDGYSMGEYHGYAGVEPDADLDARSDEYAKGYREGFADGEAAYRRTMEPVRD